MTVVLADAQLREARAALREERTCTVAERDAFARFTHRIDAIEGDHPQAPSQSASRLTGLPGSTAAVGTHHHQHHSSQGLQQVHEAYRETVMTVPHYEAEYDESLRENLAAEFGGDVATAVCETAQLTPPLQQALLQKGREAYTKRKRLLDTLDDEDDQLGAARERFTDLDSACERIEREIIEQPSTRLSFPEVYEAWHRLRDLEVECDRLLTDRQHSVHEIGAIGALGATDFYDYLYESLDVTYPILTAGMDLCDRLRVAQRRTRRELTRHA